MDYCFMPHLTREPYSAAYNARDLNYCVYDTQERDNMIYKPSNDYLWDCWIVPKDGQYYLFHLSLTAELLGKSGWNGISVAISSDLVHWKEYGPVLMKPDDAEWIGTGMVQRIGEEYIMNYSLEKPKGYQRICFAKSKDLLHWDLLDNLCLPDGVHYMNDPRYTSNGLFRWDSLGIIDALEDNGPPYYGFCTAFSAHPEKMNQSGVLPLLKSEDGINWECLPPLFADTSAFPAFEVPEHCTIGGRHYVLFCTSSYLGFRFDKYAEDMSGGTFYVVADDKLGPYRLPPCDYMLQGTRDNNMVGQTTVGRPLKVGDKLYYYHIWGENGPDGHVGMVKLLDEAEPYKLVLRYSDMNDALFGAQLTDASFDGKFSWIKNDGINPPVRITTSTDIRFENLGTGAALIHTPLSGNVGTHIQDLSDGRIVKADVTLDGEGLGFYFDTTDGKRACAMLNRKRGRIEFGYVDYGWGPNMVIKDDVRVACDVPERCSIKLFARRSFMELYINDVYVGGWRSTSQINPNMFGLYVEDCSALVQNLRICQMQ